MGISILEKSKKAKKRYNTAKNTRDDFSVGTEVIVSCSDFRFFYGNTGMVIKEPSQGYVRVLFHEPMRYEDGTVLREFSFRPDELVVLKKPKCKLCGK